MCGIVGFVDKKQKLTESERTILAKKMLLEITHRGKNASGIYSDNEVVIGHNRLSILDLSENANQPMVDSDYNFVISYNGEIYNHLEMREKNIAYETHSDTETLLHVFKKHGRSMFKMMRGMFALSLYEPKHRKITLCVDQFGIKPLYYLNTEDWFAWASELKAFRCLEGVNFSINEECLFEYGVFRTEAGNRTMLKGIYRLSPAEIIEYDIKDDITYRENYIYEYTEPEINIEESLRQSIKEHVLSDVPIGLQLSGGVDSSIISALASDHLKQKEIHSFSIGLADPRWNEFRYSRKVAHSLNTQHHEIIFDQETFCKNYPIATFYLDEPLAYPNTVPIMLLSAEASKYVKVLLSGEGADELFSGYKRYKKELSNPDENSILLSNSFLNPETVSCLFNTKNREIKVRKTLIEHLDGKSIIQKLSMYDIQTFLPSLLLRQDKMGMASTIENRFPFLDPRLVQLALNLPDLQKNDGHDSKIALKKIGRKYLPESILKRQKCGFGLPIGDWLRDPEGLGAYLKLLTDPKIKRPHLNYPNIIKSISEHLLFEKDNSEALWILLSLELWTKIFIDGDDPGTIWSHLNAKNRLTTSSSTSLL